MRCDYEVNYVVNYVVREWYEALRTHQNRLERPNMGSQTGS